MLVLDTNVVSEAFRPRRDRIEAPRGRTAGPPISQSDAQIAAIARASGFALVTRNVSDFEQTGVVIVNPWEHPAP